MEYETNSHCKHLIALHLILVVKYRKPLLSGALGDFVKQRVAELALISDFSVEEMEVDKDHIHILLRISPRYSIGQHVRRIKQQLNKALWLKSPHLKQQFWRENTF